jgi:hypothetical protein
MGQLGEMGLSSNGKIGERDVDIRGSKYPSRLRVVSFFPDEQVLNNTDCMLDICDPVNQPK